MNWLMAHRVASIAAANLLGRLGLPEDRFVDVFAALRRCGLAVMGDDDLSSSLFGAYLPPAPTRPAGIMLNSTMGEATIRHTAAHELGHAEFGHKVCRVEVLDPVNAPPHTQWPDEEKQAEAFAAWFLMPMRSVKSTLIRLGLDMPQEAADVYQLSLHLGASYRGTLRHLGNMKMVKPGVRQGWERVQPVKLRARLCGDAQDVPARAWDLTGLTEGGRLPVEVGDRLIVRAPWLGAEPEFTGPAGVEMRPERRAVAAEEGVEFDVTEPIDSESELIVTSQNGAARWSIRLMPTPIGRRGLIADGRADLLVGPDRKVRQ